MLMYVEGGEPWMERECMKVGDVGKYSVRLDTGKLLVHEWDRQNESHTKFMKDVIVAKNNDEIGLMFTESYGGVSMGFKHPCTLGDQTGVRNVWFSL